jgi:type IX secretion system substrate protein
MEWKKQSKLLGNKFLRSKYRRGPVRDYVRIQLNNTKSSNVEISLINQLGQEIWAQNVKIINQGYTLDLSHYASGVYFLTLQMDAQLFKK